MKKECLVELKKNYDVNDMLYLTSKNYNWIITKLEKGYRLDVKQKDGGLSNLQHLNGIYDTIELTNKVIFERVNWYEFVTM